MGTQAKQANSGEAPAPTVFIGKNASAFEYRVGGSLKKIVQLPRRDEMLAYIATVKMCELRICTTAKVCARIIGQIEALGFGVAVREDWGGGVTVYARATRMSVRGQEEPADGPAGEPVTAVPGGPTRQPEFAMPNRCTRRDLKSARTARAAWRATKRAGCALW
jgi:hypothetical protein